MTLNRTMPLGVAPAVMPRWQAPEATGLPCDVYAVGRPDSLRSLLGEEGPMRTVGVSPFARVPLELAFGVGSDGQHYDPLATGPTTARQVPSGACRRPTPLRLWQCGDLRGEVVEHDDGHFHIAIQIPSCADPRCRHDLERFFFVYLQLVWGGDAQRLVTSLLIWNSPQYEAVPLSLNGTAPRTMGQWALEYGRMLFRERQIRLAEALTMYRAGHALLCTTLLGDRAPTCEALSAAQHTSYAAYVAACIERKRNPPPPPARPPTPKQLRVIAITALITKYFTIDAGVHNVRYSAPYNALNRLLRAGVASDALDAALVSAQEQIASLRSTAPARENMRILYDVVYNLSTAWKRDGAEALHTDRIYKLVEDALRSSLPTQRNLGVSIATHAPTPLQNAIESLRSEFFPRTRPIPQGTWMDPSHPVILLRELLLRNGVFDPADVAWCDATLRAARARIHTEGAGLDILRQDGVLHLVLRYLSRIATRKAARDHHLRDLDGIALTEAMLVNAWYEERRWAMVCALAQAHVGGQRLGEEVAAFVAETNPIVLTTEGVASIRQWANALSVAWHMTDPTASVLVIRQLLGEPHCAAMAAEYGVPTGYQFQTMHVVATWVRKGKVAVTDIENWLRFFFAGWKARDLRVLSSVLRIDGTGNDHTITIRTARTGLSNAEQAARRRRTVEYALSLPWASVEQPRALAAAVAEALPLIHAFARMQRAGVVSRSAQPVQPTQPARSDTPATNPPTVPKLPPVYTATIHSLITAAGKGLKHDPAHVFLRKVQVRVVAMMANGELPSQPTNATVRTLQRLIESIRDEDRP